VNNKELQAIRKALFLDVSEAAEHIGGVSTRSWRRWEDGTNPVPDDVEAALEALAERRLLMIENIDNIANDQSADELDVAYYMTLAEYQADHHQATLIDWRLSQAVAAYYFADNVATLS
jgi:hypothetical protein